MRIRVLFTLMLALAVSPSLAQDQRRNGDGRPPGRAAEARPGATAPTLRSLQQRMAEKRIAERRPALRMLIQRRAALLRNMPGPHHGSDLRGELRERLPRLQGREGRTGERSSPRSSRREPLQREPHGMLRDQLRDLRHPRDLRHERDLRHKPQPPQQPQQRRGSATEQKGGSAKGQQRGAPEKQQRGAAAGQQRARPEPRDREDVRARNERPMSGSPKKETPKNKNVTPKSATPVKHKRDQRA